MTAWDGIRERVLALGSMPASNKVFGALGHRFELDPPLTAGQLGELESRLGTELPDEYRSFLLTVGAGGAGPAYGVFPVRPTGDGDWRWLGDGAEMTDAGLTASPFPSPVDPAFLAALRADQPGEEDFEDLDDFDPVYEAWEERIAAVLYTPARTAGALCLCHFGCAQRAWLVVIGAERGRMWNDSRCDFADLEPLLNEDGTPVTFASWYLSWLEESEAACGVAVRIP